MKATKSFSNKNNYIPWIDVAKGIGIILVVIGHSMFPKHNLIDGFHMPLFFLLAGVTLSTKLTFTDFFKKKFVRIMMPCIFYYTIQTITGVKNGPIWFLYTLFCGLAILYPMITNLNKVVSAVIMLVLSLLLSGEHNIQFLINDKIVLILNSTCYIYLGYICKELIISTPPMRKLILVE